MNRQEREMMGRILDAFINLQNPLQVERDVLAAICVGNDAEGQILRSADLARGILDDQRYGNVATTQQFGKALEYYLWRNPNIPNIVFTSENVVRQSELCGENVWFNSEFQVDFFGRYKLHDNVVILLDQKRLAIGLAHERKNGIDHGNLKTLRWLAPYLDRGFANLRSWNAQLVQAGAFQLCCESVSEPVVVIFQGRLAAASLGARDLLELDSSPSNRNLYLKEFLDVCRSIRGLSAGIPTWQSRMGGTFRLFGKRIEKDASGTEALLIRMVPLRSEVSTTIENREAALRCGLTSRESEVFAFLALGLGTREVARELRISPSTVAAHLRHIFEKLNVSNRIEAVNVVRRGLPR